MPRHGPDGADALRTLLPLVDRFLDSLPPADGQSLAERRVAVLGEVGESLDAGRHGVAWWDSPDRCGQARLGRFVADATRQAPGGPAWMPGAPGLAMTLEEALEASTARTFIVAAGEAEFGLIHEIPSRRGNQQAVFLYGVDATDRAIGTLSTPADVAFLPCAKGDPIPWTILERQARLVDDLHDGLARATKLLESRSARKLDDGFDDPGVQEALRLLALAGQTGATDALLRMRRGQGDESAAFLLAIRSGHLTEARALAGSAARRSLVRRDFDDVVAWSGACHLLDDYRDPGTQDEAWRDHLSRGSKDLLQNSEYSPGHKARRLADLCAPQGFLHEVLHQQFPLIALRGREEVAPLQAALEAIGTEETKALARLVNRIGCHLVDRTDSVESPWEGATARAEALRPLFPAAGDHLRCYLEAASTWFARPGVPVIVEGPPRTRQVRFALPWSVAQAMVGAFFGQCTTGSEARREAGVSVTADGKLQVRLSVEGSCLTPDSVDRLRRATGNLGSALSSNDWVDRFRIVSVPADGLEVLTFPAADPTLRTAGLHPYATGTTLLLEFPCLIDGGPAVASSPLPALKDRTEALLIDDGDHFGALLAWANARFDRVIATQGPLQGRKGADLVKPIRSPGIVLVHIHYGCDSPDLRLAPGDAVRALLDGPVSPRTAPAGREVDVLRQVGARLDLSCPIVAVTGGEATPDLARRAWLPDLPRVHLWNASDFLRGDASFPPPGPAEAAAGPTTASRSAHDARHALRTRLGFLQGELQRFPLNLPRLRDALGGNATLPDLATLLAAAGTRVPPWLLESLEEVEELRPFALQLRPYLEPGGTP